ncbi:MAG: hypothetical protein AMXMBFR7_39160 [Planctomycetota bacterium]
MSQALRPAVSWLITGCFLATVGMAWGEEAAPTPAPAAEAGHPDVIVDGVRYTWEEAKKKFPDIDAAKDKGVTTGPSATVEPAAPAAPAAEPVVLKDEAKPAAEEPKQEAAKAEEKPKEKKKKKKGEPAVLINEPDPEHAAHVELMRSRERVALEERIKRQISLLTTPEWRVAQADLIKVGRDAVPFLIDSMKVDGDYDYALKSYSLQGPRRATRQRPLAEVTYEVLVNLLHNHSNYQGELPGRHAAKWEEFWAANASSVQLAGETLVQTPVTPPVAP